MTASSELPYPPFELADRVIKLPEDGLTGYVHYEMQGRATMEQLVEMLPEDYSFEGRRMLDFGCGAGRILRHFHDQAEGARFVGCDIDQRSVDWLNENLCPPFEAVRSEVDPPLPFEDSSFDFIWAISVFTHLTDNSAPWLLELGRLLKPGGLLMATYMGEHNSREVADEIWDEDRIGMNVLRHSQGWDLGGPMVLMSDWWVEEHWGRAFNILDRRAHNGQTWAMLEKKDVQISPEELLAPGEDPREIRALQHNITQLQREIDELKNPPARPSRPARLKRAVRRNLRRRAGPSSS